MVNQISQQKIQFAVRRIITILMKNKWCVTDFMYNILRYQQPQNYVLI